MKRLLTVVLAASLLSAVAASASERKSPTEPAPAGTQVAAVKKIDVNRATKEDLVGVPGVGPGMAQGILDLRAKKGSFGRIEELLEVRGIKRKKLDALAQYLTVVPPVPSATSSKP